MRAESLCRVVSQILLEIQELMNAARSQCVAQQLQLYGLPHRDRGEKRRKAHQVQQMDRDLPLIFQGEYYST